jgi:hypothetical protein
MGVYAKAQFNTWVEMHIDNLQVTNDVCGLEMMCYDQNM